MTSSKRLVAGFLLLGLVACGGAAKSKQPIVQATNRASKVTVKVGGAITFLYSGVIPLQIVVTDAANLPPNQRFRSVGIAKPVSASGHRFLAGVNIIGTQGDGEFKIEPRPASPPPGVIPSIVYFQIFDTPVAPTDGRGRYDTNTTTCTVEFRDAAAVGHLTCPSLRDSAKKIISLDMTWSPA